MCGLQLLFYGDIAVWFVFEVGFGLVGCLCIVVCVFSGLVRAFVFSLIVLILRYRCCILFGCFL